MKKIKNLLFGKIEWDSCERMCTQESQKYVQEIADLQVERIHNFKYDDKNILYDINNGILCSIIGYLSNWQEVRSSYSLTCKYDVEAVAQIYASQGPDFASALDGIYSIFLWDQNQHKGWVFQDEYGSDVLYN